MSAVLGAAQPLAAQPALTNTTVREFASLAELAGCVGQEVALSDWVSITQERIDDFAKATGDFQWIHVDAQRAAKGPFGSTIAHGFLTLSLVSTMFESCVILRSVRMALNYGVNKVRFIAPVPVGSRLRARVALHSLERISPSQGGGWQSVWDVAIERDGVAKPVCAAQTVVRVYE